MADGASGGGQNPPSWWSIDLYSFINDGFPLEGWVWEFMRRARLQEVLRDRPVDAMNPEPDLESINPDFWNLFKPWNHEKWSHKSPTFLPPAAAIPGRWPKSSAGQQYGIEDQDLKEFVSVTIDLSRRDSVILRDFKAVLKELRREVPSPEKVQPRTEDWLYNNILAVWDLRQYGISWFNIAKILDLRNLDEDRYGAIVAIRNSYNSAMLYVEKGGWQKLARYIEID